MSKKGGKVRYFQLTTQPSEGQGLVEQVDWGRTHIFCELFQGFLMELGGSEVDSAADEATCQTKRGPELRGNLK